MIKRYFVRTSSLKEGMRIGQNIKDRMDRTLIARGTPLDAYLIEGLAKRGVSGVYIQEGEEDEDSDAFPQPLRTRKSKEPIVTAGTKRKR